MGHEVLPQVRVPRGKELLIGRGVGQAQGDLEAGHYRLLPLLDDLVGPAAGRRGREPLPRVKEVLVFLDQVVHLGEGSQVAEKKSINLISLVPSDPLMVVF